jgi:uncharacterized protein YfaS (alpha-2-macroglobulin family)
VVDLPVVSATTPTTTIINRKLAGGEIWEVDVEPHGIAGSNNVTVNLSGAIPFNLENRLKYLIRYPHGCIEQTTSSVFPQLYLNDLMTLSSEEATKVENNIRAAINRIASFQTSNGGFAYWPGLSSANEWGSNYAGHFLAEAIAAGYSVPNELYSPWLDYQKEMANSWTASSQSSSTTNQAYRLYTLVLANEADFAAMNRLRVLPNLGKTASLILAEAYYRYGLVEVANSIDTTLPSDFTEQDDRYTYGSDVRNQAIAMRSAVVRGDDQQADLLAEQLGEYMASDHWYSTQTVAYTLLAFSEYLTGNGNGVKALIDIEGFDEVSVNSEKTIVSLPLPQIQDDAQTVLISNDLQRPIYASISVEGLPEPGNEVAVANKLSLQLDWLDEEGKQIDSVQSLKQGRNISLNVTVSNDTKRDIENLALTQVFPSGWEIENKRLEGQEQNEVFDYQDIRDDRVLTYFSLAAGQTRTYNLTLHMTYAGVFYLPGTHVEAMYDNSYQAATVGQWVEVSR